MVLSVESRVAIYLCEIEFCDLQRIASHNPVWLISSPHNLIAIEKLRSEYPLLSSQLTVINGPKTEGLSEWLTENIGSIELHHGEFSHDPPVTTFEVRGISLAPLLREKLEQLGFRRFEESIGTPAGFIAFRNR